MEAKQRTWLVGAAAILLALQLAALPVHALADTVGPYEVTGASGAYAWDDATTTLAVSADGVLVAGSGAGGSANVSLAPAATQLGLGPQAAVDTLSAPDAATLTVTGQGSSIAIVDVPAGITVQGTGSLAIGDADTWVDVGGASTVTLTGAVSMASVTQGATLALGPQAAVGSVLAPYGTLDLSQVTPGTPVAANGAVLGSTAGQLAIVAPFGVQSLPEILDVRQMHVIGTSIAVVEQGERVGTMGQDGTFEITATRVVAFYGFDGQPLGQQVVLLFGAAEAPEVDVPAGYEFLGWDGEFGYVTRDMEVAALFAQLPEPEPEPEPEPDSELGFASDDSDAPAGEALATAAWRQSLTQATGPAGEATPLPALGEQQPLALPAMAAAAAALTALCLACRRISRA